jgi:hypothetical protein
MKSLLEFLSQLALRPVYQRELTNYLALADDLERRIMAATKEIKQQLKADPRAVADDDTRCWTPDGVSAVERDW